MSRYVPCYSELISHAAGEEDNTQCFICDRWVPVSATKTVLDDRLVCPGCAQSIKENAFKPLWLTFQDIMTPSHLATVKDEERTEGHVSIKHGRTNFHE